MVYDEICLAAFPLFNGIIQKKKLTQRHVFVVVVPVTEFAIFFLTKESSFEATGLHRVEGEGALQAVYSTAVPHAPVVRY